jgi:hypothetical protein
MKHGNNRCRINPGLATIRNILIGVSQMISKDTGIGRYDLQVMHVIVLDNVFILKP